MRNRDVLLNIARMYPHRTPGGYMYADKPNGYKSAATLYVYMRSHEGTHFVHETLFTLKGGKVRNPKEWEAWIKSTVLSGSGDPNDTPGQRDGILRGSVIPGIETRTGKLWSIDKVIGFTTHDIQQPRSSKVDTTRHTTKRKRRKS